MPEIFDIPSEEMPSKSVSVSIAEPNFSDRREASRRYPTSSRVGYSMEELFLSMQIKKKNDAEIGQVPTDPIRVLGTFSHVDGQFLLNTFLSMFFIDEEQAAETKELGMDMKVSSDEVHSVPAGKLPVSGVSFSFRTPTLQDRMEVDKAYPGADSNCGYSLEEMLFAYCLTSLDGKPVERVREVITLIDGWTHLDAQYAVAVFVNAVTIDSVDRNKSKSLGKSLRAKRKGASAKSTSESSKKKAKEDTST